MKANAVLALGLAALVGCSGGGGEKAPKKSAEAKAEAPKFALASEPAGAKGVLEMKDKAADGDAVVVLGRIGGSPTPFTGRAAFTIVDAKFTPCNERKDDECTMPWDYCCEAPDELKKGTVLVKFVDASGKTLAQDAKGLLGVKELDTLVIQGQAKREPDGALFIVASGFFKK